jgi:hypothetical protein
MPLSLFLSSFASSRLRGLLLLSSRRWALTDDARERPPYPAAKPHRFCGTAMIRRMIGR